MLKVCIILYQMLFWCFKDISLKVNYRDMRENIERLSCLDVKLWNMTDNSVALDIAAKAVNCVIIHNT